MRFISIFTHESSNRPPTKAEMETLLDVLDRIREHMAVKTAAELALDKAKPGRR